MTPPARNQAAATPCDRRTAFPHTATGARDDRRPPGRVRCCDRTGGVPCRTRQRRGSCVLGRGRSWGCEVPVDSNSSVSGDGDVVDSVLGLGGFSFVGLDRRQSVDALRRYAGALVRRPSAVGQHALQFAVEELSILTGTSERSPDPKDRRFADPAWQHGVWRRVAQSYLALSDAVMATVDEVGLDEASADRARFGLMQVTEALAPTNNLVTNPAAIKRAVETRGSSLRAGARHLLHDLRHNDGIPSQVDTRPFVLGENMAATPGAVIRRTEQYELIQYAPATDRVRARPVIIIPPQINRFYFLDLAPGRSLVEHTVANGQQVFLLSWRNPRPEHRSWSLDTYISACIDAIETVLDVTRTKSVNSIGLCAGGMTQSMLLGYLAAQSRPLDQRGVVGGHDDRHARTERHQQLRNRTIGGEHDHEVPSQGVAGGPRPRQGVRVGAPERPDLELLGQQLPARREPAGVRRAGVELRRDQPAESAARAVPADLTRQPAGRARRHHRARPADRSSRRSPSTTTRSAPITDHIVPGSRATKRRSCSAASTASCCRTAGTSRHWSTRRATRRRATTSVTTYPPDPADWLQGATRTTGSWWTDWVEWIDARSGNWKKAPVTLGNTRHPVIVDAPGTYVSS